ncbi:DNA-binding FadR family transcriptional regulator [Peribacillus deserti]|uniref:DNA-binding FadR family transcriptional regulator n=1 Tax=Peribacillus deserti TaxID=673318 RepID=A0ABS2QK58_9BACI|nr:GntR family transcriptional regulator [Peribacillus deserti]MBM7692873.1 DNA-binding FadR family transcriptional regulator [Peribacillus deserti]
MNDNRAASAKSTQPKIYLDIVEKLRLMIQDDGLLPGDKIPSERELSERLQVGRSSVREALRSLELLGLIETRRGEGTFIKVFQEHRLVELLGAFFLLDEKTRNNLRETKILLEQACLQGLMQKTPPEKMEEMIQWAESHDWDDEIFFKKIFQLNPNHLLERIWIVVNSYEKSSGKTSRMAQKKLYVDLLHALKNKQGQDVNSIYLSGLRK